MTDFINPDNPEFTNKPCCFCGEPIRRVINGYTVVWGGEDEPEFAHDECVPLDETTPMSQAEIVKAMTPHVHAAFEILKKKYG